MAKNKPYTLYMDDGEDKSYSTEAAAIRAGEKYADSGMGDCAIEFEGEDIWSSVNLMDDGWR